MPSACRTLPAALPALLLTALLVPAQAQEGRIEIHEALREALASGPPGSVHTVNAWLHDQGLGRSTRARIDHLTAGLRSKAAIDAASAAELRSHALRMEAQVTGPVAQAAASRGFEVVFAGALTPIVSVRGPLHAVAEWLARAPGVRALHLDLPGDEELEHSVGSIRADWVHTLPVPVTGAGVGVGVIDTNQVSSTNPYLPSGIIFYGGSTAASHATACAGMICSNHAVHRGVAPGITLLSAAYGGSESTMVARAEWAYLNGADLVSISLVVGTVAGGMLNLGDRAFDYLVRTAGKMLVKSCGNQGNAGYVTSPGRGWNCIAVGNYNDGDTKEWGNDAMSTSSSGVDPITGAPKPEVAAPGTSIVSTTTASPWIGNVGSGTSYAAPHVAGLLALLIEADPALATRPEALKAITMASAWHNIEGHDLLSELDGTGGVVAAAAIRVVQAGRHQYGSFVASDFASGSRDFTVDLKAGNRTRVVLSWDSDPAGPATYSPAALSAAFDVQVLGPGGGPPLATATHPAAAWRILAFTPTQSGPHTIRVLATMFNGATEPFGLAASQRQDADTARILGVGAHVLGTTAVYTLSDRAHPGRSYLAGASLAGGAYDQGVVLQDRTLPLVIDPLTTLSLAPGNGIFGGFQGSLDSTGTATVTVTAPAEPILIGISVHYAWLSFDAAGNILNMSPRYSSLITL